MPHLLGPQGRHPAFLAKVVALRETGRLPEAAALAHACVADDTMPIASRNLAIDVLVSAGEYQAALAAEPPPIEKPTRLAACGLALIQINLAEAEYNLGRWDMAEARLTRAQAACRRFAVTRAGLLQQRAWIAAHRGRGVEALELCASVAPRALPRVYQAELHFTMAAALIAAGRLDEAEDALARAERVAIRLSSCRNLLVLKARIAAARDDWERAEELCREATQHASRGQGGSGLLLWAEALTRLGRRKDAEDALRMAVARDPESEAACEAAAMLDSAHGQPVTRPPVP
jgi:tetratricopeptide (TPR) repeat protein